MKNIFIPHELRTLEIDTERKVFRINGEDFGRGCTGFTITCHKYDSFDIRVEVDTTVRFVSIRNGKCVVDNMHATNTPHFSDTTNDTED